MAKRWRGFASFSQAKLLEASKQGGTAAHAQGKAYEWTRKAAQRASLKRMGRSTPPFPARKVTVVNTKGVEVTQYEYYVGERNGGWVSRQRVYLLRKKGKLAA
jgi:hypothetical protein